MSLQDLSKFELPIGFRGRSAWIVQAWWLVQGTIFRHSPQFAYGWRRMLLRVFGAKIGSRVLIRPTATITYPWKVTIGDNSWVGDDVVLYSLGEIHIGVNSVVSQRTYVCAGDHDYCVSSFPIRGPSITIGDEVWIATDVYLAPGVVIGSGAVVGARSSVFSNMPPAMVCLGSPCRAVKPRSEHDKVLGGIAGAQGGV